MSFVLGCTNTLPDGCFLSSYYRWGHWASDRLSHLQKVTSYWVEGQDSETRLTLKPVSLPATPTLSHPAELKNQTKSQFATALDRPSPDASFCVWDPETFPDCCPHSAYNPASYLQSALFQPSQPVSLPTACIKVPPGSRSFSRQEKEFRRDRYSLWSQAHHHFRDSQHEQFNKWFAVEDSVNF